MKNRQLVLILTFLVWAVTPCWSQTHKLWQIGQQDGSAKEFALFNNYQGFSNKYPGGTILFEVGNSSAGEIPYFLPGPSDSWAGGVKGQLIIRFNVTDDKGGTQGKLLMNLLESHPGASPTLEIKINDYVTTVKTPRGDNQNYLDDKRTNSRNLFVKAVIPEGHIKSGDNIVLIRNIAGSWMAIDDISFSTSKSLNTGKVSAEVALLNAQTIPALYYGKNKELLQPVKLSVVNWGGKSQNININIDGSTVGTFKLSKGINELEVGIPETTTAKELKLQLISGKKLLAETTVTATPVKKWTVYLVQHTHTDIGYTKPQTEILMEHLRYIDYAIEYCELTENYPDDSKFRWTCEAAWAVNEYLKNRPQEQIDKFLRYIRKGQIEATAMFFNMAEIVDENSLKTFLQPLARYKENGIPVYTAMQNDVNGIAWSLADYLPDMGVKYVWMGEHGHRALIPFDKPTVFRWESPSGKPILAYRSEHYMTGNFWGLDKHNLNILEPNVFSYLKSLEQKDYPYDAVGIQYSGYYTDNSPPSHMVCNVINEWNEKYAYPKLRSALPHEFMDYIYSKYQGDIQSLRVAYPDWWTDGFGSAARETGASRSTHADMVTIESMLSMAEVKGKQLPKHIGDKITHIHENLLFYDEHTFGAAESLSNPLGENSQVQWAEKSSFVWEGLKSAQLLYETTAGLLQGDLRRGEHPTISLFNPMAWKRSGLITVYIDFEVIPRDKSFSIIDYSGNKLKVQPVSSRSEGRYYAIYAEDIPAMGYKTYQIVLSKESINPLPENSLAENILENQYYRITFNPETGAIESLIDKEFNQEMVDAGSPWKLGAFIYEKLANRNQMERYRTDDYTRTGLSDVKISSGVNGPIYQTVNISGKAPGIENSFGMRTEVKLFNNTKRIEFEYAVKRLPETDPSGIYVAFPFKMDDARLAFEVQGGVVYPGENQLEGTSSDWNTVQNFVVARNNQSQFILGSDVVPLMQLGDLLDGPFQYNKTYDKPHVYSWVMNNYWVTNFRASQEGEFRWNYYLTSTNDVTNKAATQFGWNSRIPFYARVMPVGKENGKADEWSAFSIENDNMLMTSCTPSKDKGYLLLNVRELDGKSTELQIKNSDGEALSFEIVNAIEEPLSSTMHSDNFKPFENKFIKLHIR